MDEQAGPVKRLERAAKLFRAHIPDPIWLITVVSGRPDSSGESLQCSVEHEFDVAEYQVVRRSFLQSNETLSIVGQSLRHRAHPGRKVEHIEASREVSGHHVLVQSDTAIIHEELRAEVREGRRSCIHRVLSEVGQRCGVDAQEVAVGRDLTHEGHGSELVKLPGKAHGAETCYTRSQRMRIHPATSVCCRIHGVGVAARMSDAQWTSGATAITTDPG